MEKQTVYKRTAKGDIEISKRLYKLDHEHRFVLILIDGKSTAEEIVSKSSEHWNPVKCLFELEKQEFIENTSLNTDSNTDQSTAFSQLKEDLIAVIQKQIPEKNTKVVNKIQNAAINKEALSKAIDSGCILIKLTISESIASALKQKMHDILDASSEV